MSDSDIIEVLAAWDHSAWAGWTIHMLDRLTPENITRWRRQAAVDFCDLMAQEQDSDRAEAREIIAVLRRAGYTIVPIDSSE